MCWLSILFPFVCILINSSVERNESTVFSSVQFNRLQHQCIYCDQHLNWYKCNELSFANKQFHTVSISFYITVQPSSLRRNSCVGHWVKGITYSHSLSHSLGCVIFTRMIFSLLRYTISLSLIVQFTVQPLTLWTNNFFPDIEQCIAAALFFEIINHHIEFLASLWTK